MRGHKRVRVTKEGAEGNNGKKTYQNIDFCDMFYADRFFSVFLYSASISGSCKRCSDNESERGRKSSNYDDE